MLRSFILVVSSLISSGGDSAHNTSGAVFGVIEFVQSEFTVSEDASMVTVTVYRHGGHQGAISATLATQDITAVAGLDYMYESLVKLQSILVFSWNSFLS
jgi:hypothetical protein